MALAQLPITIAMLEKWLTFISIFKINFKFQTKICVIGRISKIITGKQNMHKHIPFKYIPKHTYTQPGRYCHWTRPFHQTPLTNKSNRDSCCCFSNKQCDGRNETAVCPRRRNGPCSSPFRDFNFNFIYNLQHRPGLSAPLHCISSLSLYIYTACVYTQSALCVRGDTTQVSTWRLPKNCEKLFLVSGKQNLRLTFRNACARDY